MRSVLLHEALSQHVASRALALVLRRRWAARRLLGLLALVVRAGGEPALIEALLAEALGFPERSEYERQLKAWLLLRATSLLARAQLTEFALRLAPAVPIAPGMGEVLVFSTDPPRQTFCWRVAPGYALVSGRRPQPYRTDLLIQPYQEGAVVINDPYLRQVLVPQLREPDPILLLPHPLGLVQLDDRPCVILDGNHRVVWAWQQRRPTLAGIMLTAQEGEALLISHSRYPPY